MASKPVCQFINNAIRYDRIC